MKKKIVNRRKKKLSAVGIQCDENVVLYKKYMERIRVHMFSMLLYSRNMLCIHSARRKDKGINRLSELIWICTYI